MIKCVDIYPFYISFRSNYDKFWVRKRTKDITSNLLKLDYKHNISESLSNVDSKRTTTTTTSTRVQEEENQEEGEKQEEEEK